MQIVRRQPTHHWSSIARQQNKQQYIRKQAYSHTVKPKAIEVIREPQLARGQKWSEYFRNSFFGNAHMGKEIKRTQHSSRRKEKKGRDTHTMMINSLMCSKWSKDPAKSYTLITVLSRTETGPAAVGINIKPHTVAQREKERATTTVWNRHITLLDIASDQYTHHIH